MPSRLDTHLELSKALSLMSDRNLVDMLRSAEAHAGWGFHRTIEVAGAKVFAKSLPLTQLEHEHAYSTANHFGLPTFYNYGAGSAGFGAFRELAGHVKTSEWVAGGQVDTFPLLHHHRILPVSGREQQVADAELERYVAFWGDNEQIRRYIVARQQAELEVVMFLEHVPHVLHTWLPRNPEQMSNVVAEVNSTLAFLRDRDVVHFDAHVGNIVTDGTTTYLTDFGLVLDAEFDLEADERAFLHGHRHYDPGRFIVSLAVPLRRLERDWDDATREAVRERYGDTELATLLGNASELVTAGHLSMPDEYIALLRRYEGAMVMMDQFFHALGDSDKAGVSYDDDALRRELERATRV